MTTVLSFRVFPESDASLVRQILGDRPEAFEKLAVRYQRKASAIARAIGVPDSSVDDVVQEAFLRALRGLRDLRDPARFGPWFLAIARNAARQHLRKLEPAASVPSLDDQAVFAPEPLEIDDLRGYVQRKVRELPEDVREAIYLYYFDGRSTRAAARALGISPAAVSYRLERGRQILRSRLWRELGRSIEGSLPSRSRCHARARALSLILMAAMPPALARGGTAAAAAPAGLAAKTLEGGIIVSGKKLGLSAAIAAFIVLGVGLVLWHSPERGGGSGSAGGLAVKTPAGEPRAAPGSEPADGQAEAGAKGSSRAVGAAPRDARPVSLTGKVVNSDGAPVARARILALHIARWRSIGDGQKEFSWGGGFEDLRALRDRYLREAKIVPETPSSESGTFDFRGLDEGHYRVLAAHPDHLPSLETFVRVSAGSAARCEIRLIDGLSIAGSVVDGEGRPVAGARIAAEAAGSGTMKGLDRAERLREEWAEGRILLGGAETTSGPDGAFRLASLEPTTHNVTAAKDGYLPSRAFQVASGKRDLALTLSRGGVVSGRVLHHDATPLQGAVVSARPGGIREVHKIFDWRQGEDLGFLEGEPPGAKTHDDGRFRIEGLAEGVQDLVVTAAGIASLPRTITIVQEPLDLGDWVLEEPRAIAGMVVDADGRPVAGARVQAFSPPRRARTSNSVPADRTDSLAAAETSAEGRFAIGGLPAGCFDLTASSADLAPVEVRGVEAGVKDLRLKLERGIVVAGRVVGDEGGQPVSGAEVRVGFRTPRTATSDPQGAFEVRGIPISSLHRGTASVRVQHPDFDTYDDYNLAVLGRDQGSPLEIRLTRSERIIGEVVDPDGTPVSEAQVSVQSVGLPADAMGYDPAQGIRASSGSEGAFLLAAPALLRGMVGEVRFAVTASHPLRGAGRTPAFAVPAPGQDWPRARIVLSPGGTVEGRITGEAGRPIHLAQVRVRLASASSGTADPRARGKTAYSGRDGRYRVAGVQPGTCEILVQSRGYAQARLEGIEVGEEVLQQDIVLEMGHTLEGKVVDPAGAPVEGAEVVAFPEGAFMGAAFAQASDFAKRMERLRRLGLAGAWSGADGRYRLESLPDAAFLLVARLDGYEPAEVPSIRPGDPVPDLTLQRFSAVEGVVLAADTRQPLTRFSVDLIDKKKLPKAGEGGMFPDYRVASEGELAFEDPAGRFVYDGLRPGDYQVIVQSTGFVFRRQELKLKAGEVVSLEILLESGGRIEGIVLDAENGLPIVGAEVSAGRRTERYEGMLDWTSAVAEPDGSFVLSGLREGQYSPAAAHPCYLRKSLETLLEIAAGQVQRVEIRLEPGGAIEGRIAGISLSAAEGKINRSINVKRKGAEGNDWGRGHVYIDPQAHFRADNLVPGTYRLELKEQPMKPGKVVHLGPGGGFQSMEPLGPEKVTVLGDVEVKPRQTAVFNARVKAE